MSSDLYQYRVEAVEGRDVVLQVRPTTAAGLCSYPASRAFIAMLILKEEVPIEQLGKPAWHEAHIDEHVTAIRIERAQGYFWEDLLRRAATGWQIPIEHLQPRVWLRATLAYDADTVFSICDWTGTTAWDPWGADPKRAPKPGSAGSAKIEDPEPFGPMREPAASAEEAVPPLLTRWKVDPLRGLHRETDVARLRAYFWDGGNAERPGVRVRVALDVPSLMKLPAGPKRGETVDSAIVQGELRPRATYNWVRGFAGVDDEVLDLDAMTGRALEEPHETFARIARALDAPAVDVLLTRAGVIGLVEQLAASLPAKKLPPNHTRLGAGVVPELGANWAWEADTDLLWARVAVHAGLGTREDAVSALQQAQAKSKQRPKSLKALIASLGG